MDAGNDEVMKSREFYNIEQAEKNPWFAELYSIVKNESRVHIVYAEVMVNWMHKLGISETAAARIFYNFFGHRPIYF